MAERKTNSSALPTAISAFKKTEKEIASLHGRVEEAINNANYNAERTDTNYIFLYFVKNTLPVGMIGMLFAVIFLASWGSISAALNSLAACSVKDVHLIFFEEAPNEKHELRLSRLHTLGWGIFSIGVAMFATQMGSLIEAVNILGSLFYGPILGIFLVAFYYKKIPGQVVFFAAILAEVTVIGIYNFDIVSFLWLNVVGAAAVGGFSAVGLLFYKPKILS